LVSRERRETQKRHEKVDSRRLKNRSVSKKREKNREKKLKKKLKKKPIEKR
jgi:hypothetical protein